MSFIPVEELTSYPSRASLRSARRRVSSLRCGLRRPPIRTPYPHHRPGRLRHRSLFRLVLPPPVVMTTRRRELLHREPSGRSKTGMRFPQPRSSVVRTKMTLLSGSVTVSPILTRLVREPDLRIAVDPAHPVTQFLEPVVRRAPRLLRLRHPGASPRPPGG